MAPNLLFAKSFVRRGAATVSNASSVGFFRVGCPALLFLDHATGFHVDFGVSFFVMEYVGCALVFLFGAAAFFSFCCCSFFSVLLAQCLSVLLAQCLSVLLLPALFRFAAATAIRIASKQQRLDEEIRSFGTDEGCSAA